MLFAQLQFTARLPQPVPRLAWAGDHGPLSPVGKYRLARQLALNEPSLGLALGRILSRAWPVLGDRGTEWRERRRGSGCGRAACDGLSALAHPCHALGCMELREHRGAKPPQAVLDPVGVGRRHPRGAWMARPEGRCDRHEGWGGSSLGRSAVALRRRSICTRPCGSA